MNKNESRYFNTARRMDLAFLELLERKDFAYITVKEICERARVNRSTFYLHYETMEDLLAESVEYLNEDFMAHMNQDADDFMQRLKEGSFEELYLITPEYLTPYLEYIRSHKRLFRTALKNGKLLRLDRSYDAMFRFIFTPVLERYQVPPENRQYIMMFYLHGLMAIFNQWLEGDCRDTIESIISIIQKCIGQYEKNVFGNPE